MNVLGYTWNIKNYTISLKQKPNQLQSEQLTERVILKEKASVFDPCELFSPILLRGKILLQMLWNKHLNWEDSVDDQDMKMWEMIKFDLEQLHDCKLRRCLTTGKN